MGKGDKKTKRGKITIGSYGKKRKKKKTTSAITPKKVEVKAKTATKPKAEGKSKIQTKEKATAKPARPAGGTEIKEKATPKKE